MLILFSTLESSIIIATHSRLVPRPPTMPAFHEMDLAMSMDMQPPLSTSTSFQGDDWDNWTDEPVIDLCEIRLGLDFDSVNMSMHLPCLQPRTACSNCFTCIALSSHPLQTLRCQPGHLSKLVFVPRNQPHDADTKNPCAMHLLVSYLDFDNGEDFIHITSVFSETSSDLCTPTSDLLVYSLTRNEHGQNNSQPAWVSHP